jgi:hypothetical protein
MTPIADIGVDMEQLMNLQGSNANRIQPFATLGARTADSITV